MLFYGYNSLLHLNIFYKYDIQNGKKEVIKENSTSVEFYFDRGNLFAIDTTKEEENRYQITQILELGKRIHRTFPKEIEPVESYRDMRYSNLKIGYRRGREFYVYDFEKNQERVVANLEKSGENGYIEYIGEDYVYMMEYGPTSDGIDDCFFYKVNKDGKKTLIDSWIAYDI